MNGLKQELNLTIRSSLEILGVMVKMCKIISHYTDVSHTQTMTMTHPHRSKSIKVIPECKCEGKLKSLCPYFFQPKY
jgi:hypothetical protein